MSASGEVRPVRLRTATVLRVEESQCDVWSEGVTRTVAFAPQIPTPRVERVLPGNLVAVATSRAGLDVVVWRWYDAIVTGDEPDGTVGLWEPAHGAVVAVRRREGADYEPGSRAYLSAGFPGADWWVAGPVVARPDEADVELDAVDALYVAYDMWAAALDG